MYNLWYLGQYTGNANRKLVFYVLDARGGADEFKRLWRAFRRRTFLAPDDFELVVGLRSLADFQHVNETIAMTWFCPVRISWMLLADIDWVAFMPKLSYYILSRDADEDLALLDFACVSGVKIVPLAKLDDFYFIPDDVDALSQRTQLEALIARHLFLRFDPREYQYVLCQMGLGELCGFFFDIQRYRDKVGKKIAVVCFDDSRRQLLRHAPGVDVAVTVDVLVYAYLSDFYGEKYGIVNIVDSWFSAHAINFMETSGLSDVPATIQCMQEFLKIPVTARVDKTPFDLSAECARTAQAKFAELGLRQGRAVFLIADGQTLLGDSLEKDFWLALIDELRGRGYDVVAKGNKEMFSQVPFAYFPPLETAAFANLCGNVISVGTGIFYVIGVFGDRERIRHLKLIVTAGNSIATRKGNFSQWVSRILALRIKSIGNDMTGGFAAAMLDEYQRDWRACSDIPCQIVLQDRQFSREGMIAQLTADM